MRDYDQKFNSAEYDRNRDKIKNRLRRSKDRIIDRKRRKQMKSHYTTYFENDDVIMYEYVYETIPEHVEKRVRKYYDPNAIDYAFDDDRQRVIKKKGREVTEVTEVLIPEKRVKRYLGRKTVPTPKYLKRKSDTNIKKFLKKISNKRVRKAGNDEETAAVVRHNGHKRFFDRWLAD